MSLRKIKRLLRQGGIEQARLIYNTALDNKAKASLLNNKILFRNLIKADQVDGVKAMLEFGFNPNAVLDDGMTSIGWVVYDVKDSPERKEIADLLVEAGAELSCSCVTHGHILCESLFASNHGMFLYFLDKIETLHELEKAVDGSGKSAEIYAMQASDTNIAKAFAEKKKQLTGLEKKKRSEVEIKTESDQGTNAYSMVDDNTIEVTQTLQSGIHLSEVYNFNSCRRITITKTADALNTSSEDFENIAEQDAISDAAAELERQGGMPGERWKKHIAKKLTPAAGVAGI